MIDDDAQAIHIRAAPGTPSSGACSSDGGSPIASIYSSQPPSPDNEPSAAGHGDPVSPSTSSKRLRLPGKKSAVRRPPNAFILYRKKWHSIIAEKSPGLLNNEISVILGKQWKGESEQVKAEFKALANELKELHALQNPGYSYAPRKTSEVKRRMTASKRAKQDTAQEPNNVHVVIGTGDVTMSGLNQANVSEVAAFHVPVSATALLESERPTFPSYIEPYSATKFSAVMPTGHSTVEADYAYTMYGSTTDRLRAFDPPRDITAYTLRQVTNQDDFMTSLIDWEAVSQDMDIVRKSTSQEFAQAATSEAGQAVMTFNDLEEEAKFQDELDRFLWMLA